MHGRAQRSAAPRPAHLDNSSRALQAACCPGCRCCIVAVRLWLWPEGSARRTLGCPSPTLRSLARQRLLQAPRATSVPWQAAMSRPWAHAGRRVPAVVAAAALAVVLLPAAALLRSDTGAPRRALYHFLSCCGAPSHSAALSPLLQATSTCCSTAGCSSQSAVSQALSTSGLWPCRSRWRRRLSLPAHSRRPHHLGPAALPRRWLLGCWPRPPLRPRRCWPHQPQRPRRHRHARPCSSPPLSSCLPPPRPWPPPALPVCLRQRCRLRLLRQQSCWQGPYLLRSRRRPPARWHPPRLLLPCPAQQLSRSQRPRQKRLLLPQLPHPRQLHRLRLRLLSR